MKVRMSDIKSWMVPHTKLQICLSNTSTAEPKKQPEKVSFSVKLRRESETERLRLRPHYAG